MIQNSKISILGCGWMGLPLARDLIRQGYTVKGSTTSREKLEILKQDHIDPFLVQLSADTVSDREGFFDCDTLIIAVPPKGEPDNYRMQMGNLIHVLEKHVSRVIYVSSTSVYGNNNREENEDSIARPDTLAGKAIKLVEEQLFSNPSFETTAIRFGGLAGKGRYPGRFLAGKKEISNGMAPVNLIHLDDCIGLISSVLKNDLFGRILNACAPDHPSRKEFYTLAAQVAGLPEPHFTDELKEWKIVNSLYIPGLLNYDFKIRDWMQWLISNKEYS